MLIYVFFNNNSNGNIKNQLQRQLKQIFFLTTILYY